MTVRQTTRVPKHLHAWLADRAKANHRSLNAELISILSIEAAKSVGTDVNFAGMVSGTRGCE